MEEWLIWYKYKLDIIFVHDFSFKKYKTLCVPFCFL